MHTSAVIVRIPATGECLEMRLSEDESGLLYLSTWPGRDVAYSLPSMLQLGWQIVDCTLEERALMDAHGLDMRP
jgi:hypothetical protein